MFVDLGAVVIRPILRVGLALNALRDRDRLGYGFRIGTGRSCLSGRTAKPNEHGRLALPPVGHVPSVSMSPRKQLILSRVNLADRNPESAGDLFQCHVRRAVLGIFQPANMALENTCFRSQPPFASCRISPEASESFCQHAAPSFSYCGQKSVHPYAPVAVP